MKEYNWPLIIAIIVLVSNNSIYFPLSLKLYRDYGDATPCGALLNALTQESLKKADLEKDDFKRAGALIGTTLGMSLAEKQIKSMPFWECSIAISKLK